jgi:hypothetical protein
MEALSTLAQDVVARLKVRGLTLATAESCTVDALSTLLAEVLELEISSSAGSFKIVQGVAAWRTGRPSRLRECRKSARRRNYGAWCARLFRV